MFDVYTGTYGKCTSIVDIQMSHNGHTFSHFSSMNISFHTTFLTLHNFCFLLATIPHQQKEQSQTLRSALQQKAKNQPSSSSSKSSGAKRKFKPGQAKTLSDLPQLSA
jgi:hypothetical protein